MFDATTKMNLLSNFMEHSRHHFESVSVIGLLLSGPCGITKGLSEICGQAALWAGDADDDSALSGCNFTPASYIVV